MKYKKDGFIDFLFGDWLYIRAVKRAFDQDELSARCSYAYDIATDYHRGFENPFHQKMIDVLYGPIVERDTSIPTMDTLDIIARETMLLFVGLSHIHALEFSNGNADNAEKITSQIFTDKKPGYEIENSEFKEYLECSNIDEVGYIFVNKISNTFNIGDTKTISELRRTVEQFDQFFVKKMGPAFLKPKEALVFELTKDFSPWSGVRTVFAILFVILIINLISYSPDKDPNIIVEACRVDTAKCYTLKANYIGEYCESEYTTRGQTGSCIDSYIEKIYFDNGGYRSFYRNDCSEIRSSEWLCTDNDGDDWNIEYVRKIE